MKNHVLRDHKKMDIRSFSRPVVIALGLLSVSFYPSYAENWPAWRGPRGDGRSAETTFPLRWSPSENIRWRTPLPEKGNSTPIIWGDAVFITQAEGTRREVRAFSRMNGQLLWRSGVDYPDKEQSHETNPQCSSSPVTDGERVIAFFGSAGVCCYDFQGKELWRSDLGKQTHIWGSGSGMVLYRDLCILNFGPGRRTFLVALNKTNGKIVWQTDEPGGNAGENPKDWRGSWSTPLLIPRGPGQELIINFPLRVAAFDPGTGRELWTCGGLGPLSYASPVAAEGIVVSMSGYMGPALAVRAGGNGDVTETHRVWHAPKAPQRIGSPVIKDGYIYILNDPGVAECFALKSGERIWGERLEGPSKQYPSWSSMVEAAGKLYGLNKAGETFILEAAPKFTMLSVNALGEPTLASVALSNGQIYIRTHQTLWCIGMASGAAQNMSPGIATANPRRAQGLTEP